MRLEVTFFMVVYKKNETKKAVSLLEVIIVMGISVIILSLGITSITSFRSRIELQNGYADLLSFIQSAENSARNSTTSATLLSSSGGDHAESVPDYYTIEFDQDNNFSLLACVEINKDTVNCFIEQSKIKASRFGNITITSSCSRIGFKKLVGNMVKIDNTGKVTDSGICNIVIGHKSSSRFEVLEIDLTVNKIDAPKSK